MKLQTATGPIITLEYRSTLTLLLNQGRVRVRGPGGSSFLGLGLGLSSQAERGQRGQRGLSSGSPHGPRAGAGAPRGGGAFGVLLCSPWPVRGRRRRFDLNEVVAGAF